MNTNHYIFKNHVNYDALDAAFALLNQLKEELYLADETAVQNVLDLCYEKGGVVVGYCQNIPCAMLGYLWGEPKCDFINQDVGFMYVAGILKPYRHTGIFLRGLQFSLSVFQAAGVREIRLQAEKANPYTNRLYARFAQPISQDRSLNGKEVITYGTTVDSALGALSLGRATPSNTHMSHLMPNGTNR